MDSDNKIVKFINNLESFSGKKIKYRSEFESLLKVAEKNNKIDLILDLSFYCKFTWKSLNLLRKNIPETAGFDKLENEFNSQIQKVTDIMKGLILLLKENERNSFEKKFLNSDPSSFQYLLEFIYDLTWIKNWCLENDNKLWN